MSGTERREQILARIQNSITPISATQLASLFHVSRQVIVQDIALLRATGIDILSTHRGYLVHTPASVQRVLKLCHTDEQLKDELETVVDLGGCVANVMVHHKVYGTLEAELNIDSRRKVAEFLESIRAGKSSPLKNITSDYHYHRIIADSEATLTLIENELRKRGFLVEQQL